MVMQTEHANAWAIWPRTVDDAIVAALEGIRERTAELRKPGDSGYMDDYFRDWAREVLETQDEPIVMIAIAHGDDVTTVIMQGGHDGVLEARTTRGLTRIDFGGRQFLHNELMTRTSWLWKEELGEHVE